MPFFIFVFANFREGILFTSKIQSLLGLSFMKELLFSFIQSMDQTRIHSKNYVSTYYAPGINADAGKAKMDDGLLCFAKVFRLSLISLRSHKDFLSKYIIGSNLQFRKMLLWRTYLGEKNH